MRVRVLGASPVRPNPGGVCTGYLVQSDAASLLIDCGTGVLGQLLLHATLPGLDAVFISHAHPDHCLDLVNIRQSLAYVPSERRQQPLPVLASAETIATLEALGKVFGGPEVDYWDGYCRFQEVSPARAERVGPWSLDFAWTRHYIPCLALGARTERARLVFGADGGPDEAMVRFAADSDLLILESTLLEAQAEAEGPERGHLSGAEAGRLAARAGARRLLLTHYFAELGPQVLVEARAAGNVPVDLARQGALHDI